MGLEQLPKASMSYRCSNAVRRLWQEMAERNARFHDRLYTRWPITMKVGGWFLRELYDWIISPAFAVLLTLLLVGLVISEKVTIIVSVSVFAAWLVAVLSFVKYEWVNKLRIVERITVVALAAAIMAFAANHYVRWVLVSYAKASEKPVPAGHLDAIAMQRLKDLFDQEIARVTTTIPVPMTPAPNKRPAIPGIAAEQTADVAIEFAGKEDLELQLADKRPYPAEKPKHWYAVVDLTNQFVDNRFPGIYQPLPLAVQTAPDDYIRGNDRMGPWSVLSESQGESAKHHVKAGDVITGIVSATCFNCVRVRSYYIYFTMGSGGWFYPIPAGKEVGIPFANAQSLSLEVANTYIDRYIPKEDRLPIDDNFDYHKLTKQLP